MQSPDRRVRRTQAALQTALAVLITQKRYPSITVTDILDRADVGRSTFYAHYDSKDALLRSAAEHVVEQLENALPDDGRLVVLPLFEHAQEHADLYRALARGPAAQIFLDGLRHHLARRLAVTPPSSGHTAGDVAADVVADVAAAYESSAIVGTLTWWLDHRPDLPAFQVAQTVDAMRRASQPTPAT